MATWGDHLVDVEHYARFSDSSQIRRIEGKDESTTTDSAISSYRHASHVMLWAPTSKIAIEQFPRRAIVLMQMRFDGYIGFPGGLVDEGEEPEEGALRELIEEINYNVEFGKITEEDRLFSHADDAKKLILHFYTKQLTEKVIEQVIIDSTGASDYGNESLGLVHVPLYTMCDGYRGLPAFLKHNFVGHAQSQLTEALVDLSLLTWEEIKAALQKVPSPYKGKS